MTDDPPSPDMNDLARRYLDLWQDHLQAVAKDTDTSETLARTMALMSSGAQAFADAATKASHDDDADGAAPAATAPGGADAQPDELARRVAALEKRVAELESELGRRGGGTGNGD